MSINDIHLSPHLLTSLYPHSLIQPEPNLAAKAKPAVATGQMPDTSIPAEQTIPAPPTTAWPVLGKNLQNILLVVDYPEALHLPDDELDFLVKILTACKLSLGDVAIINLHNYTGTAAPEILQHFNPGKAILLGIEPAAFGLAVNFPAYQLQQVGTTRFFHAPALSERHHDDLYKSKLWVCLRQLFGI